MNKRILIILAFLASNLACLMANGGYEIKVRIDEFDQKEIFLGYYYGEKQYIKDTVQIDQDGYFIFKGEEPLEGGIYLLVLPPDNQFIQILINPGEQHFSVVANAANLGKDLKFSGSQENKWFYEYTSFLNDKKPEADKIKADIEAAGDNKTEVERLEKKLEDLDQVVKTYQNKFISDHPKSFTAAIIKSSLDVPIPEFEGEKSEVEMKRYLFYKKHYFDNYDMTDPRMLRTPMLFGRINYYVEKLTVQHPDSISKSIDYILSMVQPSQETYKFYLIHFLNTYAKSKFVGMDAVYVHLGDKYYCAGKAWWVDEEQLNKICANVETLRPILIGKVAPNIQVQRKDGTLLSLHDVKSDFTVLFFWDPECGHCKKSIPDVVAFYDKFSSRGVEIFGVCTKTGEDTGGCWDAIEERNMGKWINTIDPYLRSKYKTLYDIRTTPKIFVLDKDKKIISKGIGGEQLEEVLEQAIINMENQQLNK